MTAAEVLHERQEARTQRIIEAIEHADRDIASAVDALISALIEQGAMRIHRRWSRSEEEKLIREEAAKLALKHVLTNDWMLELPAEAMALNAETVQ